MSLIQAKKDLEQFFFDNYSTTPVHWAGMKWDATTQSEWVYFEFIGNSISNASINNDDESLEGTIVVSVIASSIFRVNEIGSIVVDLFRGKNVGGMFVRKTYIDGQGYIEDIDKSYLDINMKLNMV